jgi:hypothetical protein
MKKVLKITGVIALALILVCNLEYALFSGDIKSTPNKAFADWYDVGGTHYCGSSPDTGLLTGHWRSTTDSGILYYYSTTTGYFPGATIIYYFVPDSAGTDCGYAHLYSRGLANEPTVYGYPYSPDYHLADYELTTYDWWTGSSLY